LLRKLGYSKVRDYAAGLEDWVETGEPLEAPAATSLPHGRTTEAFGPGLLVPIDGEPGTGPARISDGAKSRDSISEIVARLSTAQLFSIWIGLVVLCGFGYWSAALMGEHGLIESGSLLGADLHGLLGALYFSFVTAVSLGYGDIVPVGSARGLAIIEAIMALLIFGAVIAKFVSHRQDELVLEIHRVTFDERLDRVQSNLHVVISELLSIQSLCEAQTVPLPRMAISLDSAVRLFLSELRTTHALLYQPRLLVEEVVLAGILGDLSAALDVLAELLTCLPAEFVRSQPLELTLENVTRIAADICGTCVPHSYTPRLTFWMERIQTTARRIH
jgi:Ion channel